MFNSGYGTRRVTLLVGPAATHTTSPLSMLYISTRQALYQKRSSRPRAQRLPDHGRLPLSAHAHTPTRGNFSHHKVNLGASRHGHAPMVRHFRVGVVAHTTSGVHGVVCSSCKGASSACAFSTSSVQLTAPASSCSHEPLPSAP